MRCIYSIVFLINILFKENKFEGLDESYQLVRSLIKTELEKGIPAERIALVGFSQGAAVALYTAVQYNGVCINNGKF